jgi:hypothetical protein
VRWRLVENKYRKKMAGSLPGTRLRYGIVKLATELTRFLLVDCSGNSSLTEFFVQFPATLSILEPVTRSVTLTGSRLPPPFGAQLAPQMRVASSVAYNINSHIVFRSSLVSAFVSDFPSSSTSPHRRFHFTVSKYNSNSTGALDPP